MASKKSSPKKAGSPKRAPARQTPPPEGSPRFEMDRLDAVPRLVGEHRDFLFVSGLAGTARDLAHLTEDGDHLFTMAGTMGAAVSTGLGLALAQPDKKVLVMTGDGELLMNVGALATVGVLNPPNLSIVCVDNGHYGETGYQLSHTSLGVDLEQMAVGAGIKATRTVETPEQIDSASRLLRESNGTSFVLLRVKPTDPPSYRRDMNPASGRVRFRRNIIANR